MKDKILEEWLRERDEVVKKYDVEEFKLFFKKWQGRGMYNKRMPLPSDEIIEVSMRKMVYHMTSATEQEKKEAETWLIAHGSSTSI